MLCARMSRPCQRRGRARPRDWESHGIASKSFVAESDARTGGTASLSQRHPGSDWNAAEMVSPAVRDEESMGGSCGSRIGIPHGDVDADSRRLAGETGGMADSALAADCGSRDKKIEKGIPFPPRVGGGFV